MRDLYRRVADQAQYRSGPRRTWDDRNSADGGDRTRDNRCLRPDLYQLGYNGMVLGVGLAPTRDAINAPRPLVLGARLLISATSSMGCLVPGEGLEPSRISPTVFETAACYHFATLAWVWWGWPDLNRHGVLPPTAPQTAACYHFATSPWRPISRPVSLAGLEPATSLDTQSSDFTNLPTRTWCARADSNRQNLPWLRRATLPICPRARGAPSRTRTETPCDRRF